MNINDLHQLLDRKQSKKFIATLCQEAQNAYQDLVKLIHADGYSVESYHIPLISEERRAYATVLQRTVGLVDLNTDREVLMLYSSFLRPDGAAVQSEWATPVVALIWRVSAILTL